MKLPVFILLISASLAFAQDSKPRYEMKTYYMVFLMKGDNRSQDSTTAAAIQKGHMDNIQKLGEEGKLQVAGPFLDDTDLRGIFIFDAENEEEVKKLCETDPAVIAGRLKYEIHPWMTAKGTCLK